MIGARVTSGARTIALTIAGLDPSGGAGVIADIKTFSALGCFATAAITSITFQNPSALFGAQHLSAADVRAQVMPIVAECAVIGVKTGMLPTSEIVQEVTRLVREEKLPAPVVDPVMRSTSDYALIEDGALEALLEELLPLARLITPNIPEAERITGLVIVDEAGMRRAAKAIRDLGARAVLIKGGHLKSRESRVQSHESDGVREETREAIDVLDDDGTVTIFRGEWIDAGNVRGTGCMLSAAIAACLARGMNLSEAVSGGKRFVSESIAASVV
jgi:hydroxymethylpyrimidine kinase/phosphomethylpyrimidine kinase